MQSNLAKIVDMTVAGLQNAPGGSTLKDVVAVALDDAVQGGLVESERANVLEPWLEALLEVWSRPQRTRAQRTREG